MPPAAATRLRKKTKPPLREVSLRKNHTCKMAFQKGRAKTCEPVSWGAPARLPRPAHGCINYALTFRTATAAATTATMIMAKPITLALSPVLGMDTVGSRMMGVLLAFQVMESDTL